MSSSSLPNPNNMPAPIGGNLGGAGGKWNKAAWLPVLIGGLFATLTIAGSALLGRWHRRRHDADGGEPLDSGSDVLISPTPPPPRPGRHEQREKASLARLRAAIVGNDKDAIVKVLGPPPTTGGYAIGSVVLSGQPEFYRADTWYYPMDPSRQRAIAIEFDDQVARAAQIIEAPSPK